MTEQPYNDPVLQKTLVLLVKQVGLTPAELAQLRLSHLHLAGKSPNLNFVPAGNDQPKTVALDLEAHRALVGWLVARPDSKGSYLFPGVQAEPMPIEDIERLTLDAGNTTSTAEQPPVEAVTPEPAPPRSVQPPPFGPPGFRPEPPPFRPEDMGPPPLERLDATLVSRPQAAPAPEGSDKVDLPLPTAAPRPPAPPPESGESDTIPDEPAAPLPAAGGQPPRRVPFPGSPEAGRLGTKVGAVQPQPPESISKITAEKAAQKARPLDQKPAWRTYLLPGVLGLVVLPCLVCAAGGWYFYQNDAASGWLTALIGPAETSEPAIASLETVEAEEQVTDVFESPVNSPLPTPTLPPTATATATVSPTPTPLPTNTPVQTDAPAPQPTNTPPPTDTPAPTNTPTNTATPAPPAATATPADTPTPAMKYGAPVLREPEDGYSFIQGNTLVLRWEPVGELAPAEQYAVRLVYRFNNAVTYQGANVKETEWTIPLSMYGQIDGPEYLYEWFVVVERLNDDGSGTAISPESEHRRFVWR